MKSEVMSEIAIKSDLKPSSFDTSCDRLTSGQKALLQMLNKHLKEQRPITRDDIEVLYISISSPDGMKTYYRYDQYDPINKKWSYRAVREPMKGKWSTKTAMMQWFKNNLGSCIIKGKLLAIPVIEINET